MNYTFITARSGEIVPAINGLPLHSTVDPAREARKLLTTIPEDTGFLIFLGLGGGFAPLAALETTDSQVAVIDFDRENTGALLESKDYSALLNNERFSLLIDPANEEIQNFILARYKPSLYGNIKVFPLRTRVDCSRELFESCANSIQQAISKVSSDFSVQAFFGKRWFCNIIRNIANMRADQSNEPMRLFPKKIEKAAIAAAGPSLDHQINELAKYKESGGFIVSSDTALGALLHNGIRPDAVVSIDCQYKSYYHFLGHELNDIPLVLDIASPPMLSGLASSHMFFASGHPLAQYISANWRPLPQLDTSGGNVAYACFSFLEFLGAADVTLFGADFAYVRSQSYARGTYVNPYFEERQNRIKTLETLSSAFMYRSPFLEPENPSQTYRETEQLRFYRSKLEEKAGVGIKPGSGNPVQFSLHSGHFAIGTIAKSTADILRSERAQRAQRLLKSNKSPVEFLENYRNKIADSNDQDILTALLPYAAFLKHRNPKLKTNELLNETRHCCIREIERVITNIGRFNV